MPSTGETAGDIAIDDLAIAIRERLFVIPGVREIVEELLAPRGPGLHSACNYPTGISAAGKSASAGKLPPDIAIPPGGRHGAPIAPGSPPRSGRGDGYRDAISLPSPLAGPPANAQEGRVGDVAAAANPGRI
jgi:hypothetical protein